MALASRTVTIAGRAPERSRHGRRRHFCPSVSGVAAGIDRVRGRHAVTAAPALIVAIIDDDDSLRRALSSLLRAEGMAVRVFESAEAFLAASAGEMPDAVLTDIQMPGMSGLDLQDRLNRLYPGLPVLVMTALPDRPLRERALSSGAVTVLNKPIDAGVLLARLQDLANRGED